RTSRHDVEVWHARLTDGRLEVLDRIEHIAQSSFVADAEDLVKLRAAEVGIDQQDPPAIERQTGREVARNRALAVARTWAGDQDAARRIERCGMLETR